MKGKKLLILVSTICLALILVALPLVAACEEEVTPPAEEEEEEEGPPAGEEEEEELQTFVMRVSSPEAEDSGILLAAAECAANVEERSNGQLRIEIYPLAQIIPVEASYDALKAGVIQMFIGDVSPWGIPILNGLTQPIYDSREHLYEAWKAGNRDLVQAELEEHNMTLLGYQLRVGTEVGACVLTNFPCHVPADLEGRLMRAPGTFAPMLMEAAGASVVSMPAAEQYLALQRGTIDGTFTLYERASERSLQEVVDYVCLFQMDHGATVFPVNLEFFNSLPEELQNILVEEFDKYFDMEGERIAEEFAIADQLMKDAGVIVYNPTPAELAEWHALAQPAVDEWVELMGTVGEEWLANTEEAR